MMWTRRNEERGSGGPVLRDPLASRARQQQQPYLSDRQQNNGSFNDRNSFNVSMSNQAINNQQQLFPSALEETYFPPPQHNFIQQAPTPAHVSVKSLLGPNPSLMGSENHFNMNLSGHNSPIPIFHGSSTSSPFETGSNVENNAANFQHSLAIPPSSHIHTPIQQALLNLVQSPAPFSASPGRNFGNNNKPRQLETLDLQPQWSIQNESPFNGGSSPDWRVDSPTFERRPFNRQSQEQTSGKSVPGFGPPFNSNNVGFERRPNNNRPSQSDRKPQQQGPARLFGEDNASSSGFSQHQGPSHWSTNSSNKSFGGSNPGHNRPNFNQNTQQQQQPPSFGSQRQNPIPALLSLDPQPRFNSLNNNKGFQNKGNNFNQQQTKQFQSKRPCPPSGPPSTNKNNWNKNNTNITPNKAQSGPLLPTPKLIPYPPPPPLHSKSSDGDGSPLLRNPRGILKNAGATEYSNFVKGSNNNDSSLSSPVVPYPVGDDDDDDEVEFVSESKTGGLSSSNMTHDFFSEKMVQHFSSILNGKSLEDQLDELLKYLVLPADFLATRVSIVRNLHFMLRETFKKSVLQPYGADFIGVGNSDDSVNVFVDLTGNQGPSLQISAVDIKPSEVTKENLDELLNLIQEDKNHKFFGQIVRRTNFTFSRFNLPVISFIHSETKVRCNIRLDNYLLVQEAKVIQFVGSLDSRISSLLALARYWSSVHKVLDTPEEDTKNRFVTLLMLFFLARKKIIPTMAELQSLSVNREYFNNLDIGFCDDYSLVPQNENPALQDKTVFTLSTLSLLKEFFKLFAEARLKDEVVSLWKAEFIPKENFGPNVEGKVLSPDLRKRYRHGANGKLRDKRIDCESRLCIQDFQDLTENLSLAVAEYDVSKFQVECDEACKKIENIMLSGSGNLMDLFVVSEYASFGTPEHTAMHRVVYLLYSISDERSGRISDIPQTPTDRTISSISTIVSEKSNHCILTITSAPL